MIKLNEYLKTIQSVNTKKVAKSVLEKIPQNTDIKNIDILELENLILNLNPNSQKSIITSCYILALYAKYCKYDVTYKNIQSLDRESLWMKAKIKAPKKFISNQSYMELLYKIGVYEELNGFYFQILFKAIYEGIYNEDMSVLDNLRSSDINGNIVTLRPNNNECYNLKVSENLADQMKKLSEISVWQRRNRYGYFDISINGKFKDTVFKVENRKEDSEKSSRFIYYGKLRKISKNYLEYKLEPLQIFISGIMYRIKLNLDQDGITLREAFKRENRNRKVNSVIENELKRCRYDIDVKNFREIVKGHIEIFEK